MRTKMRFCYLYRESMALRMTAINGVRFTERKFCKQAATLYFFKKMNIFYINN